MLQTLSQVWVPDPWRMGTNTDFSFTSTKKEAFLFQVPKTGTITAVGFALNTVTSSQTIRVTIQTVDGSTGDPTGSNYGGCVKGTQASPASNTAYEVTLGTPATAVQGDLVAVVLEYESTAGTINVNEIQLYQDWTFPFVDEFNGATWGKLNRAPNVSIKYSDGTYGDIFGYPAAFVAQTTYNSGSTPDEHALRFSLPFPCRAMGCWIRTTAGTSADYSMVLYGADGTTVLAQYAVDGTILRTTGEQASIWRFTAPAILKANTAYRLALKPTTTNNVTVQVMTVLNNAMLDSVSGGKNFYYSTRTDAGAWTDTTNKRPAIGLLLDQLHDGQVSDIFNV